MGAGEGRRRGGRRLVACAVLCLGLGCRSDLRPARNAPLEPYLIVLADGSPAAVAESRPGNWPKCDRKSVSWELHRGLWVARRSSDPRSPSAVCDLGWREPVVTEPGGATGYRLAVYGNTGGDSAIHRRVVAAVRDERVGLVLHTGQMVEQGQEESDEAWREFLAVERPVLSESALVALPSPAERGARFLVRELPAKRPSCLVFDRAALRLVVFEPEQVSPAHLRCVEQALADGARKRRMQVLAVHDPPLSSGLLGWRLSSQPIAGALALRHRVALVISGGDHHYERSVPQHGTIFIVTGAAGGPELPVYPRRSAAFLRQEPHYLIIDAEARGLTVRATSVESATTFDFLFLPSRSPGP